MRDKGELSSLAVGTSSGSGNSSLTVKAYYSQLQYHQQTLGGLSKTYPSWEENRVEQEEKEQHYYSVHNYLRRSYLRNNKWYQSLVRSFDLQKNKHSSSVEENGLAQVESRLVEHKDREIKYCEKIRGLEFKTESSDDYIEILKKKLETLKKEKEGLDGKLAGFQTASKDFLFWVVANEMVRLIETASVPIFTVDGDRNISGWNDKMGELTRLPLLEAVGVPLVNLVVDDSVNEVKPCYPLLYEASRRKTLKSALMLTLIWSLISSGNSSTVGTLLH
nr:phytochrome C [Tanacetum cinerariifolium]